MRNAPDRELRRLIANLASARPEDVTAVLDGLPPAARERARALLAEYLGEPLPAQRLIAPEPAPQRPLPSKPIKLEGLSEWLAARLEQGPIGRHGDQSFSLTPTACDALRACAAALELRPEPRPLPAAAWLASLKDGLRRAWPA